VIRVASYNMRKAIGTDRRRRPERTLEVLNELDADVVALQEADRRFGARASALPQRLIAEHSDYKPVAFEARAGSLGWHGNALLVKKHVEVMDVAALDLPMLEPRGAVMAELLIGNRTLRVVGMHLDLSGLWRRRQMLAILDAIRRRPHKMPTILMGDLNSTPEGSAYRQLAATEVSGLRDALLSSRTPPYGPFGTFNAFKINSDPESPIDHIFVSAEFAVEKYAVVTQHWGGRLPSDHYPVMVDLIFHGR